MNDIEIDGYWTPQNVGERIKAANAVRNYGDFLLAIVEGKTVEELKTATDKFTQSLRGLDPGKSGISDDQLNAIGEAIQAVGGLFIEHQLAQALKEIVPKAHDAIATIGSLLEKEFASAGPATMNLNQEVLMLIGAVDGQLDLPKLGTVRQYAAEARVLGYQSSESANSVLPNISMSARKMVAAHMALKDALTSGTFSIENVKEFGRSVESLIAVSSVFD